MRKTIVLVVLFAVGCADDPMMTTNSDWCATHRRQCPGDWDEGRGTCESFCGSGVPGASAHEDCLFAYCSVQEVFCDNDQDDDTAIAACIDQITGTTGAWCSTYESQCPDDWDSSQGTCEDTCGSSVPTSSSSEDCQFGYCSVQSGFCDNEQEGDTAIIACIDAL